MPPTRARPCCSRQVLDSIEADKKGFRFMGTDVACSQIDKHKAKFADKQSWAFQCVDYANERLPSGYELVFSRDSLQHVPMHAVWQFLNNVRASGAKYLLVGAAAGRCGPMAHAAPAPAASPAAMQDARIPWIRPGC
jgi:hypothetical protein